VLYGATSVSSLLPDALESVSCPQHVRLRVEGGPARLRIHDWRRSLHPRAARPIRLGMTGALLMLPPKAAMCCQPVFFIGESGFPMSTNRRANHSRPRRADISKSAVMPEPKSGEGPGYSDPPVCIAAVLATLPPRQAHHCSDSKPLQCVQ